MAGGYERLRLGGDFPQALFIRIEQRGHHKAPWRIHSHAQVHMAEAAYAVPQVVRVEVGVAWQHAGHGIQHYVVQGYVWHIQLFRRQLKLLSVIHYAGGVKGNGVRELRHFA